jgi:hypothetical protein
LDDVTVPAKDNASASVVSSSSLRIQDADEAASAGAHGGGGSSAPRQATKQGTVATAVPQRQHQQQSNRPGEVHRENQRPAKSSADKKRERQQGHEELRQFKQVLNSFTFQSQVPETEEDIAKYIEERKKKYPRNKPEQTSTKDGHESDSHAQYVPAHVDAQEPATAIPSSSTSGRNPSSNVPLERKGRALSGSQHQYSTPSGHKPSTNTSSSRSRTGILNAILKPDVEKQNARILDILQFMADRGLLGND